ncbi:MAG TPA: hypothetical protein VGF40_14395 [Thermoanaerobaculia bacterium]
MKRAGTLLEPSSCRMGALPPFGPLRDRRRRKRLLTKRNVLITVIAVFVLFTAISVWSEVSDKARFGQGRLYSSRVNLPDLPPRHSYAVVSEEEVSSSAGADPLLLDYSRREAILGVEPGMLERQNGIDPDAPPLDWSESSLGVAPGSAPTQTGTAEVAITGGAEGVRIEKRQD